LERGVCFSYRRVAHGNCFDREFRIEHFCSGEYNPTCAAGIPPDAADYDWLVCDPGLKKGFDMIVTEGPLLSEKGKGGHALSAWIANPDSNQFID
jgi:hypothetical protein